MGSVSRSRTAPRTNAVSKGFYEAWGRIIRWANIAFMCPRPQSASDNLVDDIFQNVFFFLNDGKCSVVFTLSSFLSI